MTTPYPDPGRPAAVPPGWYPGPTGAPQWWDGRGWGPTAPPAADNSSTLALFAHLGTFVGGFIVPLIIRQTEGRKNRFVKHHATEALNFAITNGIVSLVLFLVYIVGILVTVIGTANSGDPTDVGWFVGIIVLVFVLLFAVSITAVVFTVIAAVKAGQKKYWRYPIAIRFVKGAASREEVDALNRGVV